MEEERILQKPTGGRFLQNSLAWGIGGRKRTQLINGSGFSRTPYPSREGFEATLTLTYFTSMSTSYSKPSLFSCWQS